MKEDAILLNALSKAKNKFKKEFIDSNIAKNIDILIENINKNKSLLSALVTSCMKKEMSPEQDIRLPRKDFKGGYSGRSLDTRFTTPFFKKHFPKYANKESSFLTLATREKIAWTLSEGENLKIRNKDVKRAFLNVLDAIENKSIKSENCLIYIFSKLIELSTQSQKIFHNAISTSYLNGIININKVIEMLSNHFSMNNSSRLPVIAIYSIYQELFDSIKRYNGKILHRLNVHTSSDKHGYGDIEIFNQDETPFEIVEIKHNIPIDRNLVFDVVKKTLSTKTERYYILTTYPNSFASLKEEQYCNKFILKIKKDYNLEIITNGIITSLKYYLRFIDDYQRFLKSYTKNLIEDAKNSTEINNEHIEKWNEIMELSINIQK